jgi:hypothetical protein
MQIKGSKYAIFGTHQIPTNLHFTSPLAKQNQSKKHKFAVVGETIAFSICNKSFKRQGHTIWTWFLLWQLCSDKVQPFGL